ncbi:MAG: hypothetical protein EXR39_16115 [Betaproteobacteria bacterium]|nr:hypothetical protein [Betaproteobacteria bacterium]
MGFAYFLFFHDRAAPTMRITSAEEARVIELVRTVPDLQRGLVFTPTEATDPYLNDGPSPQLALELYFDDIVALENALAPKGHLQTLAAPNALPSLTRAAVQQQAMLSRPYPVPTPNPVNHAEDLRCTYLVEYPGQAEDLNEWLWYYISHHPQLMANFDGIREIEICTRIDWCGFLPWPCANVMQRNKVVFDNPAALQASLNSPVRHAMREDFHKFPPFTGGNLHYPMITREV